MGPTAHKDSLSEIATMKQHRGQRKEKRRAKRQCYSFVLVATCTHLIITCATQSNNSIWRKSIQARLGLDRFGWDTLEMQCGSF